MLSTDNNCVSHSPGAYSGSPAGQSRKKMSDMRGEAEMAFFLELVSGCWCWIATVGS